MIGYMDGSRFVKTTDTEKIKKLVPLLAAEGLKNLPKDFIKKVVDNMNKED